MSGDHAERVKILEYWWMLELFNPQSIPKPTPRATRPESQQVIAWTPGEDLPWDRLPNPAPGRDGKPRTWRHTLYLGVYRLADTYEALHRAFAEDPDAGDDRPGGANACAGILVDGDGRFVASTAILSSAAWAVGRVQDPGPWSPERLRGFETAQADFVETVDGFESRRRDSAGADFPVRADARALIDLVTLAHESAGITEAPTIATSEIVISSVVVAADRAGDGDDIDFLNSFFLDDLSAARDRAHAGDLGAALSTYLIGDEAVATGDRVDVVAAPTAVDAGVSVDRLPLGRWPSNPEHPLALSQQFAVNLALNELGPAEGLLGVNGPPGTGKTTMLRDVLAGNVVERARRLAALRAPGDAFTEVRHTWTTQAFTHRVRQLRPELTGFEMVIASSNNSAVENVSTEIPARDAIDTLWRTDADYFASIATEVLRATAKAPDDSPEAWGLVAARLGNKSNRSAFHTAFWFGDGARQSQENAPDSIPRMLTRLKRWRDGVDTPRPWATARAAFAAAEKRVTDMITERLAAQQRRERLTLAAAGIPAAENRLRLSLEPIAAVERDLAKQQLVVAQCRTSMDLADDAHRRHLQRKPGTTETLFSWGRVLKSWRAQEVPLAHTLSNAHRALTDAQERAQRISLVLTGLRSEATAAEHDLGGLRRTVRDLEIECTRDQERYGAAYPTPIPPDSASKELSDERERRAPWLDSEIDTARSELFLAALRLHEDFLANTAKEMVGSLSAACEVMVKGLPHNVKDREAKARAAWQLLFLVVPMVSTTFASVGRMFSDLGRESIGWLLVDEAGQACPQHAVGAIWRARRVVAVGDPLQLPPVVTMPPKAQRDIAAAYSVSEIWIPPRASVQTLADRVAVYGTTINQGQDPVWVSAPLRVHRRCDNPMFELCNRIAYGGIMVNGVQRRKGDPDDRFETVDEDKRPVIAHSYWADAPEITPGTHLQQNQINKLVRALNYLGDVGVPPEEIIAISPFRAVADHLAAMSNDYPGLRAGTIHTAQGREAPVVILVLGGDPAKEGAKAWAASSVNLVNVAASRAQRRLYVIGDREAWARHNYFQQLSAALN
ncbi:AAA family ATPase [Tsukamurella sputi]|uniref:AAA family ATPase n=1 Tax=Tsukamurella sputi TaxID=2591848 RepID=A0A5C5RII4_9ACTN|nr:AAA domain-containing protein [Tsukamurella sputi]TWS21925.1 AAA family ATPase [Tsukamurella sputi]